MRPRKGVPARGLPKNLPELNKTTKSYAELQAENEQLRQFACEIIKDYCWNLGDPDGGDIQDLAQKLGLIEPHTATVEDVDEEFSDFDVGDTIYKFTQILKEPEK
jgi:hypothetical protein